MRDWDFKLIHMKLLNYIALVFSVFSCDKPQSVRIVSPSEKIKIEFYVEEENISYLVKYEDKMLIDTSLISFNFKNQRTHKGTFGG